MTIFCEKANLKKGLSEPEISARDIMLLKKLPEIIRKNDQACTG